MTHGEPEIEINGVRLSRHQSMTVRVAIEHFAESLGAGLGDDDHGQTMLRLYREGIAAIRNAIYKGMVRI